MNSIRFTQEQLYVTSKIGYVDCDAKFRIQLLHPWATFFGDMLLSPNNQDHTFLNDDNIPVLNQQTRLLLHLWRPYLTQHIQQYLNLVMHISLRQIAAKIPSQLHNYFLPSFLRDLQHKRKPFSTLPLKPIMKTLRHLRSSLSFIFQQHLARK